MKPASFPFLVLVASFLLNALPGRADEASYAAVVKERDAVLSQIVAQREAPRAAGVADEEAIAAAQLALYSFRRDVAATTVGKIKQQELIVGIFAKKLEFAHARQRTGMAGSIEMLEAQDRYLEAKLALEELKLREAKS